MKWLCSVIVCSVLIAVTSVPGLGADVEFQCENFLSEAKEVIEEPLPLSFQTKDIEWTFEMSKSYLTKTSFDEANFVFGGLTYNR